MDLARNKWKYFFQAGIELTEIWSLAINDEEEKEMVSKLFIHVQLFF